MAAYVEEAVVRRELSDNFCYYHPHYDSIDCAEPWARESLDKHAQDRREFVYTEQELEAARTHDRLWNAAQRQLVVDGKIHGFMRMVGRTRRRRHAHARVAVLGQEDPGVDRVAGGGAGRRAASK